MLATLVDSRELAQGVRHFVFEAEELSFIPGQFASFTATIDGKEITRAYSIANAPAGNRFHLCLNLVNDGNMTPYLFAMQPGDTIEMRPPLGTFTLRNPDRPAVMIATGTGIAPFRSIILAQPKAPGWTLLFGVRYETHLYYRAEFEARAANDPQFDFWPTLSRPDAEWSGRTGHVQAHLEEAIAGRKDLDFYLCGLKAMVDDVRQILKSRGFDRKQIFYEKYD